ncbi:proto-oncogene tyrosine-protein kinase ROS-like [Anoplolepis gracilipes]|uniref:proto-oncogene tyrosine-protein kinase ROS-like n=1 Tax=Anoplolepis gracilipes TaxID=354296 RepID=UPI003B9E3683
MQEEKIIMLKKLKTLCVLLKVLILMRVAIATLSGNLEDDVTLNISASEINDHFMLSNISSNYINEAESADIVPSKPTFPRAFVDFGNRLIVKDNISVTFRWNQPEFTNGEIQKYRIQYCFIENLKTIIRVANISAKQHILQYKAYNLKPDTMYYFKVQAHNEAGAGLYTNFINVSTTHENPIPLLLTLRSHMEVLDVDLQISFALKEYNAKEVAYSELERKIYWNNDNFELMTCDLYLSATEIKCNYTKIMDLDNSVHSLCIDWVARNLYWLQYDNIDQTNVMKLDLTLWQNGIVKYDIILQRNEYISFLNVLPFTGDT